jgi:hypothetical protein
MYDIMNFRTIIRDEETRRKQPTPSENTKNCIKDRTNDANHAVSTSVFLYEVIMMILEVDEDEYSRKEECVDEKLCNILPTDFLEIVENTKLENRFGIPPSKGRIGIENDDEDGKSDSPINLNLPESLVSELEDRWGKRYWTDHLTDLMVKYVNSPFDSRYDRINFKQDIIEHEVDSKQPSHRVLKNILNGDTKRYSEEAEQILDTLQDEKWWREENLTWEQVNNREHILRSKNVSRAKKKNILQAGLDAYARERDTQLSEKWAVNLITSLLDVRKDYARSEYLQDIELGDFSESVVSIPEYVNKCEDGQKQLAETMRNNGHESKSATVESMNPVEVYCVTPEKVNELDQTQDKETRIELIESILEESPLYNEYKKFQQQKRLYKTLRNELVNEYRELLD